MFETVSIHTDDRQHFTWNLPVWQWILKDSLADIYSKLYNSIVKNIKRMVLDPKLTADILYSQEKKKKN